jgi:hypothetical protein
MPYYTILDDGCTVTLHSKLATVFANLTGLDLSLEPNADAPANSKEIIAAIKKAMRNDKPLRLYDVGKYDWAYKLVKHRKAT